MDTNGDFTQISTASLPVTAYNTGTKICENFVKHVYYAIQYEENNKYLHPVSASVSFVLQSTSGSDPVI